METRLISRIGLTLIVGAAAAPCFAQFSTVAQFSDLPGSIFAIKTATSGGVSKAAIGSIPSQSEFLLSVPAFGQGVHFEAYLSMTTLYGLYSGTSDAGSYLMHSLGGTPTIAFWDAQSHDEIMAMTFQQASLNVFDRQIRSFTASGAQNVQFFSFGSDSMPHFRHDSGSFSFSLAPVGTREYGATFTSAAVVPEPVTSGLMLAAAAFFLRRRLKHSHKESV